MKGREVYKASIFDGELKIVYYGMVGANEAHCPREAYNRLTRKKGRAAWAYIPYTCRSRIALQILFGGASQVQHRPGKPTTHPIKPTVRRKKR